MSAPAPITIRIRLANGETIQVRELTVGAAVARYPWPVAVAWEVVPAVGAFW